MKNKLLLLLFTACIGKAFSQVKQNIEIPFTMEKNLILIKVDLSRTKQLDFVFDTGTEGIMVMDSVANAFPTVGIDTILNPKGEIQGTLEKILLPKLKFGKLLLKNKQALKMPREMLLSKKAVGIIGMQTFVGYTITFDYKRQKIILSQNSLLSNARAIPIKIDHILEGNITLNGKEVLAHFDCGGAGYIAIPKRWDSIYKLQSEPVLVGNGRTPMGDFEVFKANLDGNISIGNYMLKDPKITLITGDFFYSVNLGYEFFKQHLITINTKNKLLLIEFPSS